MVILGIDAHKQTHTVVVVDEHGRKLGERTVKTTTPDHFDLLIWADLSPRCSDTWAHPPLAQNGDASFVLTAKSKNQEASP